MDGNWAIPIFDRQPPLPKIAPVRIVNHDKTYNDEREFVLVSSYIEGQAYIPEEGLSDH